MSTLYRQRIVVVGNEQDMIRLAMVLLDNAGYLELPEDRPPYTLAELTDQIQQRIINKQGKAE